MTITLIVICEKAVFSQYQLILTGATNVQLLSDFEENSMQMMTRRRQTKEQDPTGNGTGANASPEKSRGPYHSRNLSGNLHLAVIGIVLTATIIFGMTRIDASEIEKMLGIARTHGQMVKRAPKRKTKMACVDKAQKA